jgi:transcriptional regulator with XRE-family HTH domain
VKIDELRSKLRQDPEYVAAEQELEPFLQLADEVLRLRLERGWSQSELARRAGTGQTNISRIECGLANPTLATISNIAEAFGVDLTIRLGGQAHEQERAYASLAEVYARFENSLSRPSREPCFTEQCSLMLRCDLKSNLPASCFPIFGSASLTSGSASHTTREHPGKVAADWLIYSADLTIEECVT